MSHLSTDLNLVQIKRLRAGRKFRSEKDGNKKNFVTSQKEMARLTVPKDLGEIREIKNSDEFSDLFESLFASAEVLIKNKKPDLKVPQNHSIIESQDHQESSTLGTPVPQILQIRSKEKVQFENLNRFLTGNLDRKPEIPIVDLVSDSESSSMTVQLSSNSSTNSETEIEES